MEDSLLIEYLKSKLSTLHERDLPPEIKLPSGEVLKLNGIKYLDKRGQAYSYGEVQSIIQGQVQRRRDARDNNKRWRPKGPRDTYDDPSYVDGSAELYGTVGGSQEFLRLGDCDYYENPSLKTLDTMLKKSSAVGFAVTSSGDVLMSPDPGFADYNFVRQIQRYYRVDLESVGIITKAPMGMYYLGCAGNLTIAKSQFKNQLARIIKTEHILDKAYRGVLRPSPKIKEFITWCNRAWSDWQAPLNQFEFHKWSNKQYTEDQYRRAPEDPDAPRGKKTFIYRPTKAFVVPDNRMGRGLEDQLAFDANNKIRPPRERDLQQMGKAAQYYTGEAAKVRDIIDQAYSEDKITKEMKVKAMIVLDRAVKNNSDKAIYQLKSIMLRALKG